MGVVAVMGLIVAVKVLLMLTTPIVGPLTATPAGGVGPGGFALPASANRTSRMSSLMLQVPPGNVWRCSQCAICLPRPTSATEYDRPPTKARNATAAFEGDWIAGIQVIRGLYELVLPGGGVVLAVRRADRVA